MERAFDELISLQKRRPIGRWRAAAWDWAIDVIADFVTALAVGAGIAIGLALA